MSTTTFTPFAAAAEEIRDLPKLACIGYVGQVGEAKISASGDYVVQKLTIEPTQGGKKAFTTLLYRPEWLRPGFNPMELKSADNPSFLAVYRMHIGGSRTDENPKGGLSTLAGIAGSMENFYQVAGQIQAAIEGVEDADVPEAVRVVLSDFVNDTNPTVGYILKQKEEDTGERDGNGRKIKTKANGYEVGSWFHEGTDVQFVAKQAAANKLVLGFEV